MKNELNKLLVDVEGSKKEHENALLAEQKKPKN